MYLGIVTFYSNYSPCISSFWYGNLPHHLQLLTHLLLKTTQPTVTTFNCNFIIHSPIFTYQRHISNIFPNWSFLFVKYQLQFKYPTDLTYCCYLQTYFTHSCSWNALEPNIWCWNNIFNSLPFNFKLFKARNSFKLPIIYLECFWWSSAHKFFRECCCYF